jgi:hypothetical protein
VNGNIGQSFEEPIFGSRKASISGLLFGLASGPAAWIVQLVVNYGLAGHACFPNDAPRPLGPSAIIAQSDTLMFVSVACLALAISGLAVSYWSWRQVRRPGDQGVEGEPNVAVGRVRFLSLCGMLASAGFAIAVLFDAVPIFGVPACWTI